MDADVHLGHHRQSQRRDPQPPRRRACCRSITEIELGMHRDDGALLVMPMCHANSLYFFGAFAYCGATTTVYSRKSFDPEHCARVLGDGVATLHLDGADPLRHDARRCPRRSARNSISIASPS